MPSMSIQQFRAALVRGTDSGAAAYRKLTRRPDLAAAMRAAGWIPWSAAPATQTRS